MRFAARVHPSLGVRGWQSSLVLEADARTPTAEPFITRTAGRASESREGQSGAACRSVPPSLEDCLRLLGTAIVEAMHAESTRVRGDEHDLASDADDRPVGSG